MRTRGIFIGGPLCLFLAAGVSAQVRVGPFPPGQGQGVGGRATPVPWDQVGMIAIEPLESVRPVTGAPYTADAVTQTTQMLADGNRIEQRSTATIARDSKGRVRREQQALALAGLVVDSPFVTISDPTSRTHVTLDRERRVAFRIKTPSVDPATGRDPRSVEGPRSKIGPAPGGGNVKTETLGERDLEGVRAEGTRTTITIPAHAIGNQAPVITVSERWFSPDLQAVVLTQRSDPRFGKTVYRLVNIVRTEPPAELFEIPADYRIEEQTLPRPVPPLRK
jgi:hypothetical protein